MARRRMIDPHFWRSVSVSRLDYFERVMLIGMISNADDYGKGYADVAAVRSDIFYFEDIPTRKIENALKHIRDNISITFYMFEKVKYYKFDNWMKYQKLDHPTPSQIPEPTRESIQEYFAKKSRKSRESISTESRIPLGAQVGSENIEVPTTPPNSPPPPEGGDGAPDLCNRDLAAIVQHYESCMGFPSPLAVDGINEFLGAGMKPDVIIEAINEACASSSGRPNWKYLRGIIERWRADGLVTIDKVQADRQQRKEQKSAKTGVKKDNDWNYTVGEDGFKRDSLGNVIY